MPLCLKSLHFWSLGSHANAQKFYGLDSLRMCPVGSGQAEWTQKGFVFRTESVLTFEEIHIRSCLHQTQAFKILSDLKVLANDTHFVGTSFIFHVIWILRCLTLSSFTPAILFPCFFSQTSGCLAHWFSVCSAPWHLVILSHSSKTPDN